MKMVNKWLWVCFVIVGMAASSAFAGLAEDEADNYTIPGWGDGTSQGNGFGPWQFNTNDDGTNLFAGGFIGDPGAAGVDMDDPAFGLYANPVGAFVSAEREFWAKDGLGNTIIDEVRPLELGNVFSFEWGVNYDAQDGNKGFSLFAGTNELVNVNQGGYPGDITVNGMDTGLGHGTFPMLWSFRMAGPITLEVTATSRSNLFVEAFSTSILISDAPDRFRIYAADMTSEAQRQPYFNNFEIVTGTPPQVYFISGEDATDDLGELDFVLGRLPGGLVDDTILLSSSNTDALTVPPSINFDSADEVPFQAEVISLMDGNATITASNAASGASASFDVTMIAPTLTISGPGAVLVGQTNEYTVTRSGPVDDAITVASDDTDVLDLPVTSLNFDPEETTVTFMAVALLEGEAELTATDGAVTSPEFEVTVVDLPPTPAGVYDDGTFYPIGWEDGMNGGNGFGPWSFNISEDPPDSFAGVFVGDSANTGITGMEERVFGFYANPPDSGANAEVNRELVDALVEGEVFSFLWGLNWDSDTEGSNRGFVLLADETELVNLNMANSSEITVNGNTMFAEYGTNAVHIQIQYVTDGLVRVWATGRDGVEEYDELLSVPSGAPDNFRFYFNATTSDDQRQMYFDQLEVVMGDPVDALTLSGPTSVIEGAEPTYTVTRFGNVDDTVTLASSDTNVVTVPASITFPVGEDVQTFVAEAVAAGVAELTATDGTASSSPLSVTVNPPSPHSDDASNYGAENPWVDGSNGGSDLGPWILVDGSGGFFLGSSSEGGARTTDIDFMGQSFGMFNLGEDATAAIRTFADGVWGPGASLTFEYSFRFDAGSRGVTLHDASLEEFAFFTINAGTNYNFNGLAVPDTPWEDARENGEVLTFTFTQNGSDIDWTVTGLYPGSPDESGTIVGETLGAFRIFSAAGEGESGNDVFFNKIDVVASTEPGLVISGPDSAVVGTEPTYTVTRFNIAEDVIDLSSDDPAVVSVPATVNFDPGSPTATFDATAVAVGSANLTASAGTTESDPFAVTVTAAPEPPEGIYDDATFYEGAWNDDDNGGNGFGPWTINSENAGTFIADASVQGPNNAAINTDGVAFGMWTLEPPEETEESYFVDAIRSFSDPLSVGDVFTFQLAFRWDNGTRGFTLEDATGEVFFFGINDGGYFWSGEGSAPATPWQGPEPELDPIREAGVVLDVEVIQLDGEISVSVTSAQDPALNASGTVASGALASFQLYLTNAGGDPDGNFYANRFEVTAGDPPEPEGPVIDTFGFVAGEALVTIMGEAGKSYYLVYTTDLTAITSVNPPVLSEWEVADAVVSLGADGEVILADDTPEDDGRFYGVLITESPLP